MLGKIFDRNKIKVLTTNTGLFGIWIKSVTDFIKSGDDYRKVFTEDKGIVELMQNRNCYFWSVGGDGSIPFKIELNAESANYGELINHVKNIPLLIDEGELFVGSPEFAGAETILEAREQLLVKKVTPGAYILDVKYFFDEEKDNALTVLELRKVSENSSYPAPSEIANISEWK